MLRFAFLHVAVYFTQSNIASRRYSFDQSSHYLRIKLMTFMLLAPLSATILD